MYVFTPTCFYMQTPSVSTPLYLSFVQLEVLCQDISLGTEHNVHFIKRIYWNTVTDKDLVLTYRCKAHPTTRDSMAKQEKREDVEAARADNMAAQPHIQGQQCLEAENSPTETKGPTDIGTANSSKTVTEAGN